MSNGNGKNLPTTVAVEDRDGKVLLHFSAPTQDLVLEHDNAMLIAEGMAKAAYAARTGQQPSDQVQYLAAYVKTKVTEQLRERMVVRASKILTNLGERKREPAHIAREIVDRVLSEVA